MCQTCNKLKIVNIATVDINNVDFTTLTAQQCADILQCIIDNGTATQFEQLCAKLNLQLTVSTGADAIPANATSSVLLDLCQQETIHFYSPDNSVLITVTPGSAVVGLQVNPEGLADLITCTTSNGDPEAITQASQTLADGTTVAITGGTSSDYSASTPGDIRWQGTLTITTSNPSRLIVTPTTNGDPVILDPITWTYQNGTSPNHTSAGRLGSNGDDVIVIPGTEGVIIADGQFARAGQPQSSGITASSDWGMVIANNGTEFTLRASNSDALNVQVQPLVEKEICEILTDHDIAITNLEENSQFEHPDAGYAFCNTEDNITNGGGGTGPAIAESTFTPHADGSYIFNYSGEVLSGTGGISVGTTSGTNDIFVSAPATGDADGSRLTTTRQSNFTPALALQGGVTYFINQWAGGGGNINNHTVCVADENLSNYIDTQVNNAPTPIGWEIGSSIPSSGTVVVEDEHSYLYVQIPDGTTTLDVTGMTTGREFEIRMHPQDNIGDLTISLSDGSNIISDPGGGVNGANSTFTLLGGKNSDQGQVVRFRKMPNGQIWVTNVYPEPSSGGGHADDDVESVTGEHVDNTDPRNPIVKTWIKEECYKKEGAEVLTVSSNLNVVAANITQLQPVSSFSILCKNNGAVAKSLTMNFTAIGAGSIVSSNTLAPGETGFYDFDLGGSFTFVNGTMDPLNDADISMIALPVGSTGAITAAFGPLNGRVVVSSLDDSSSALISRVRTYDDGSTYEVDADGNAIAPITVDPSWELTDCLSSEDEVRVSELANEAIEAYTCEVPCTSFDPSAFALQSVPLTGIDFQDGLVETRYLGYFDGGFATATGLAVPQANSFYSTHFNGTDWVIQTNNSPANQVVFTPNSNTYLIARVELGASGASLESFAFECGDDVNGFQTIPKFGGLTISDNTFNGSGNAGELDVSGTWATDITSTITLCEGLNDLNSKISNTPKTIAIDCYTVPSFIFQNPSTTEVGTTQSGDGISWETVAVGQEFDRVTVLLRNTGAALTGVSYDIQDFDALITVTTDPVDIPSGDSYVTFTFPTITVTAPIHANAELNLGSGGANIFPPEIVIPHTGNGSYSPFFNANNSESWIGSVSLSTDDTQVNVSTCSDGSQTAYDSNGTEIPLDIDSWISCQDVTGDTSGTVLTSSSAFTTTNGVKVPVGGFYNSFPDGTTYATPTVAEYNEFINNYRPQYIAIAYEAAGGANVRMNVNGVDATYTDLQNATDVGGGQVNFNSGTNGNFNRRARVDAEVLKEVGDYVEIIAPDVAPFSQMIMSVVQNPTDLADSTSNVYNLRVTAGANGLVEAYTFRDKTNTAVASGSEQNQTHRITRTLSGLMYTVNGVEAYCTPVDEFTDYSNNQPSWITNTPGTAGQVLTANGDGTATWV